MVRLRERGDEDALGERAREADAARAAAGAVLGVGPDAAHAADGDDAGFAETAEPDGGVVAEAHGAEQGERRDSQMMPVCPGRSAVSGQGSGVPAHAQASPVETFAQALPGVAA